MRTPAALALLLLLTATSALQAQLFSPGKLATPHAALEGLRNCTSCHELRQRGTSNALCLECHKPLAARITAHTGLHATFTTRNCASCHRDHLGLDHRLVTLDTTAFDHDTTGFTLGGSHQDLGCRDCHKPRLIAAVDVKAWGGDHNTLSRTYLGLAVTCDGCHRTDGPHGTQFAQRTCDACHDDISWKKAPGFSHDRARFRLTGLHTTLACSACHRDASTDRRRPRIKYSGIASGTCTACHTDPHKGAMTGGCAACHTTAGWQEVAGAGLNGTFDHSRTHFPLEAAHTRVTCAECHDARTRAGGDARAPGIRITWAAGSEGSSFGRPAFASCVGCHVDQHAGVFATSPGGSACTNCHGDESWSPTTYDIGRHNRASRFMLDGAHQAVPCYACHAAPGPDSTRTTVFRIANTTCIACHSKNDPHQGQFAGRTCEGCHLTTTFALAAFDHSRTRLPLDGAHRTVPCTSCHRTETANGRTFRRYTPLGMTCRDCHGGTR